MAGKQRHPQSSMNEQLSLRQAQPRLQPNLPLKQEQQELMDQKPYLQKNQLIGQDDGSVDTQRRHMLPVQSNGSMPLHQSQQLDSQENLNMSSLQQQQQLLGTVPAVSNIPRMHMLKQIKAEVQHPLDDHQQRMRFMQPQSQQNKHQQSQHIMSPFQSQHNQLQQQLEMRQQPSMQQRFQTSARMSLQQNNIDKQKQRIQAQCDLLEVPSSKTMDVTAQIGHQGAYLQDELYDMIRSLKDQYFTKLSDLYNKVSLKLQHHMPPQMPVDHYEEMKKFKLFLESALHFLQINKSSIQPSLWEKIPEYERRIINIISSQRRKPVHTQGQQQFLQSARKIPSSKIPQQQHASPASFYSTTQTRHPGAGDWQEELYQMIKKLKDKYFTELNNLCNKISMKLQYVDSHMSPQKLTYDYGKMNDFKVMLEHVLHFLQINKGNIQPTFREKIPIYERQIISILNSQRRKPVQTHGHQQSHQSAGQGPRSKVSQQQQSSQAFLNSTAQTGHPGAGDWQEDLYQMVKRLKDQYFAELSHLCNKVSMKLQYVDRHTHTQETTGQYGKMKDFKLMLERILSLLQINKGSIHPSLRDKITVYEKQIISILNSEKRQPVQTQGQQQFPQTAGLAPGSNISQQQQSSQGLQEQDIQTNQMPQASFPGMSTGVQSYDAAGVQHVPSLETTNFGVPTAQKTVANAPQVGVGSNLEAAKGSNCNSVQHGSMSGPLEQGCSGLMEVARNAQQQSSSKHVISQFNETSPALCQTHARKRKFIVAFEGTTAGASAVASNTATITEGAASAYAGSPAQMHSGIDVNKLKVRQGAVVKSEINE